MVTVEPASRPEPRWVDIAISNLLRGGVILSITIVIIGLGVTFAHHRDYFQSRPALGELTRPGEHYPSSVQDALRGVLALRGQSIVMLGLLILIATPVGRVTFSIVVFLIEHDRMYAIVTTVVLLLLLLSFVLGATE